MYIQECRYLEGIWWAKIRVGNTAVRNPTTVVPSPSTRILYVPAALVIRARPSFLQELRMVVCRTYHLPIPRPEVVDLTFTEDVIDLTGSDEDEIIDLT